MNSTFLTTFPISEYSFSVPIQTVLQSKIREHSSKTSKKSTPIYPGRGSLSEHEKKEQRSLCEGGINSPSQFAAIFFRIGTAFLKQSLEIPLEEHTIKATGPGSTRGEAVGRELGGEGALRGRRHQGRGRLMMLPGHSG